MSFGKAMQSFWSLSDVVNLTICPACIADREMAMMRLEAAFNESVTAAVADPSCLPATIVTGPDPEFSSVTMIVLWPAHSAVSMDLI